MSASRLKSKVPFREKVNKIEARIVDIPPRMQKQNGKGTMLIPRALDIEALIDRTATGDLVSQETLRIVLAKKAGADISCPMTTGFFLRLVAEAAEEERSLKKGKIAPYWRVIKADGSINPKFPGGVEKQVELLEAEGHQIQYQKGNKPPRVAAFERYLVSF